MAFVYHLSFVLRTWPGIFVISRSYLWLLIVACRAAGGVTNGLFAYLVELGGISRL